MKLVQLGTIAEVIAGQSPEGIYYNSNRDGTPFYQGKKEFGDRFLGAPTTWTTKVTKLAEPGDILMSVRAPVGPINFSTQQICIGRGLAAIRSSKSVDRDFLFYFLLHKQPEISGNTGAVFDSINKDQIASIEIPLPSLEKQLEIVEKLDSAFVEIEKIRPNFVEQIDANLSLLLHAIRNLLDDPNVEYKNTTLDQICENLDNKRIPIARDVRTSGDYPYYGASGIIDYVEDYIFEGDALLVSEDGANLLARSTPIAFSVSGKYWVNNHAHILKFTDQELQKYVENLLENTKLDDFITGAAQPKLTQRALNTIPIRIPVKGSDIKRLVAVISSLKELSLAVSENLKLRLKLAEELQSALLSDYFTQEEAVA